MTKQQMASFHLFSLLLLAGWHPPSVAAGWRLVATASSTLAPVTANAAPHVTFSASHNKVKYETRAWTLVVHLQTQHLILLNHVRQTYWKGPLTTYLAVAERQARARRRQKAALVQRLSPEQRLVMEKRGGPFDSLSPHLEVTVTPTSDTALIAGHATTKYLVSRNGEPYEETWLTKAIHLGAEVNLKQLQRFFRQLQVARTTPPGTVLAELTSLVTRGYPVRTVNVGSGVTKELQRIERQPLSDNEFTAPQSYRPAPLFQVMSPSHSSRSPVS
jgi:hypothetical protein